MVFLLLFRQIFMKANGKRFSLRRWIFHGFEFLPVKEKRKNDKHYQNFGRWLYRMRLVCAQIDHTISNNATFESRNGCWVTTRWPLRIFHCGVYGWSAGPKETEWCKQFHIHIYVADAYTFARGSPGIGTRCEQQQYVGIEKLISILDFNSVFKWGTGIGFNFNGTK
jgi:hypothetical protein